MAYNINNVDLDKFTVYFHIPTSRLIAVEKEESKKYVFQTEEKLAGIFLSESKRKGWFEITTDKKETVIVNDLKNMTFRTAEFSR